MTTKAKHYHARDFEPPIEAKLIKRSETENPHNLYIREDIILNIKKHCRRSPRIEVAGYLLGEIYKTGDVGAIVKIVDHYPLQSTQESAYHFKFEPDEYKRALQYIQEELQGRFIVGWYHSHPSYGVSLSKQDIFVHRNFFDDLSVALVIDPLRNEVGYYGSFQSKVYEANAVYVFYF